MVILQSEVGNSSIRQPVPLQDAPIDGVELE